MDAQCVGMMLATGCLVDVVSCLRFGRRSRSWREMLLLLLVVGRVISILDYWRVEVAVHTMRAPVDESANWNTIVAAADN